MTKRTTWRRRRAARRLRLVLCAPLVAAAVGLVGAEPSPVHGPEAARPRIDEQRTMGRDEVRRGAERRQQKLRARHARKREGRPDGATATLNVPDLSDPRLGVLPDAHGGELDRIRKGGGR